MTQLRLVLENAQRAHGDRLDGDERALERGDGAVDVASRVVRQLETAMRIAARPSQVVPPIHASPLSLDLVEDAERRLVVLEAEEHLVDDDVVQQLATGQLLDAGREPGREVAAAVDEIGERPRARASAALRTR